MDAGSGERQLVVFAVGPEHYAVDISYVNRVVLWTQPTPLPESPPGVLGVIDLVGQVVPVLDLGVRFGRQRSHPDADARIMIVELHSRLVGLVVDDVLEVVKLLPGQIDPPAGPSTGMVTGIGHHGDHLLILLDPERVAQLGLAAVAEVAVS